MNKMFNDLSCMLLNNEDINYISEIKRYLTQVNTECIIIIKKIYAYYKII